MRLESHRTLPILLMLHLVHFAVSPLLIVLPHILPAVKIFFLRFSISAGFSRVFCIHCALIVEWKKGQLLIKLKVLFQILYVDNCLCDAPCVQNLDPGVTLLCIALYQCGVCGATPSSHNFMTLSPPSNMLIMTLGKEFSSWTFSKYFLCTHFLKCGWKELKNNQFLYKSFFSLFLSINNHGVTSIFQELC